MMKYLVYLIEQVPYVLEKNMNYVVVERNDL
jgi:hypothetical protein